MAVQASRMINALKICWFYVCWQRWSRFLPFFPVKKRGRYHHGSTDEEEPGKRIIEVVEMQIRNL
jgi:hypothetical protein